MKISIAVPSYNYSQFIESCLQSILEQDYYHFEVLIADGGSTDNSQDIIKRFCDQDQRFRLVSITDNGQADAVVKALAMATGDIYCFLNADDCYLSRDVLSNVVLAFKNYPKVDIVSFGGYYIDSKGKYIRPIRLRYHPLDSIALMKYRTAVIQPATFWKRTVQEAVQIKKDFHYSFDSVFFYEVYNQFSWLELSKPIAGHRLHDINKSLQIIPERIDELARFEQLKFGSLSYRYFYLKLVGTMVGIFRKIPVIGTTLCRCVYLVVNSLSFITFYRLPNM
jgi:glycosyltransferase involved in cell wall biosynthesis